MNNDDNMNYPDYIPDYKVTENYDSFLANHDELLTAMADWTLSDHNKELDELIKHKYKYKENVIIRDFHDYIDRTYREHYAVEKLQAFDAWLALGDATPTFRNTAIKYLWRYGKKKGNNKDDLMKVLHYTLMMLYNDFYKENN